MEITKKKSESTKEDVVLYRGVKAMPFIIGNETFEKLGTMGTVSNLIVYFTTMFNMKSITATTVINVFTGTVNAVPLIGAFISDTYLGRYKTLAIASMCSLMGMIVLTLTAGIPKLHPPKCAINEIGNCIGPTGGQLGLLFCALGFLILGAGGIRPCNLAFGADQFNPNTESGKRGINSFFNWYYCTYTFGMMISTTFIVYVQTNVSWTIGLAIPACLMFMSCSLFFLGTKIYVIVKPEGSAIISVVQVLIAATRKRMRRLKLPNNEFDLFNYVPTNSINTKLPRTNQFRWLDKASIITDEDLINPDGSPANPWRLCSLQQVEEAKCIMRVIPIWASGIVYYVPVVQQNTYAVLQALQSDRRLGNSGFVVPGASFIVFAMLTLTIFIPIYDRILVPFLRKLTGKEGGITILQRMGIGIVFSIVTMIVSGLVEERRRHLALTGSTIGISSRGAVSSMSALWLLPQLALAGLTEALNSVGQTEFYYKQFPENMRSIAGSFFYLGLAGSFYLSSILVSIVHHATAGSDGRDWLAEDLNKGRLDYFYYMIAILGVVNFGYFLVFAKYYRYKGSYGSIIEVKPASEAV